MKKIIYIFDFVLVFSLILVGFIFFNNMQPKVIAPINNYETSNNSVLFKIKNANYILIDDNPDFVSPDKIFLEDYLEITLEPGTYYWKIEGDDGEIRKLSVLSKIELRLRKALNYSESNNYFEVINSGNERLNVSVYDGDELKESFLLDRSDMRLKEGNKFIGNRSD